MAPASVAQPAAWTVVVETGPTIVQIAARDEHAALRAAWFQATSFVGHDAAVTIHIDGPAATFPTLIIPAAAPDPEPEAWELEPEPLELEEDEILAAWR